MGDINAGDVLNNLAENLKLNIPTAAFPQKIASSIVPTFDVLSNHGKLFMKGTGNSVSGSVGLLTVPQDKDFYLCGATLSYTTNAACDSTNLDLIIYPAEGIGGNALLRIYKQTLTAFSDTVVLDLKHPIKLSKGSTIAFTDSFGAGAASKFCSIWGYYI